MIFALVMKAISFKSIVLAAGLTFVLWMIPVPASAATGQVLVHQVQTGSPRSATEEFVSIYNNSSQSVEITDWCLEYSSASDATKARLACLETRDEHMQLWLSGYSTISFASDEFVLSNPDKQIDYIFRSGMSATSGHIKIFNQHKELVDSVGWGAASKPEGEAAKSHGPDKVIQRRSLSELELMDTDNNAADFHEADFAYLLGGLYEEYTEEPELSAVQGLRITEILPDSMGPDSGKEFIELYNSGQNEVNLRDYTIQVGPDFSKSYILPEITIDPGEYLALSDTQTGMTLPNSSGSVRLVDSSGNILDTSDVYEKPGEGVSLAFLGEGWALTYRPTPGLKNILLSEKPCPKGQTRNSETGRCRNASSEQSSDRKPCRSDQIRNPETNRCRKIASLTDSLKPCKPGQVRSLTTNRCRSIAGKTKAKVPCKSDQRRNPETGRCKKTTSASVKKPCKPGQERNAQTGRCRKVPPPINKNEIKDIESPLVANNFTWWFAGMSALGSAGYGVYEWRRELSQVLEALKIKFIG